MAPYRNVRYWLGDFRRRRALNNKEKFNHSHAKLRNVIERTYGVLKARFLILKRMTSFSLTTQRNMTITCFALHNFICKEGLDDELFFTYDQSNMQLDNENVLVEDDGGIEEDEVEWESEVIGLNGTPRMAILPAQMENTLEGTLTSTGNVHSLSRVVGSPMNCVGQKLLRGLLVF
ncbi:putative harbinger transposase-derived nuclease domain-containing protein [Tanacetum coccineum]|uniref:Harbinger transposase-derived nuclease domain-containing protein n=1 Tax=Tanacetum coccineum TaxID=301880 RepID=A0ABQ5JAN5_9ASTR